MSDLESSSSPDTTGGTSENTSTQMSAVEPYFIANVKKLPELTFRDYLRYVQPLGFEVEVKTGIYHLVPMIQSAHESRNGNSGLAKNYGNLFGIVATKSWKDGGNPVAALPTWEFLNGKRVDCVREFRAYKSWRDSFFDWARIIANLSMYKKAYELLKDKATVPQGIEVMGLVYATDPVYAKKLKATYEKALQEGIF